MALHDLSVVRYFSDDIAVMYLGRIVEEGEVQEVLDSPRHPYTEALMSAVPTIDVARQFTPIALQGEIPNPANPPAGCRFHTRCPYADRRCHTNMPEWREIEPEHFVACHYAEQLELRNF